MQKKTVVVPNINCGHCIRTIETAVSALPNVVSVHADEQNKTVEISWNEPQSWSAIKSLLEEINYPPQE